MAHTSSLYDAPRKAVWETYAPYVEGAYDALLCVCFSNPLTDIARNALEKSAQALGYQDDQVAFISLISRNEADAGSHNLQGMDLKMIIEAADPLCIVATDNEAARALAQAYHALLHFEIKDYLLGRPCCCFQDFNQAVSNTSSKQKTWRLLKSTLTLFS